MKSTRLRYGTVAVLIRWASAVLVIALIGTGFRSGFTDDTAARAAILRVHVSVALLVLVLTLGRLVWWWRFDSKPDPLPNVPGCPTRCSARRRFPTLAVWRPAPGVA